MKKNKIVYGLLIVVLMFSWLWFFRYVEDGNVENLAYSTAKPFLRAIKYTEAGEAVLLNSKGEEISRIFDEINETDLEAGLKYIRFKEDGFTGYLDGETGQVKLEAVYEEAQQMEDIAVVGDTENKWFINKSGEKLSDVFSDIDYYVGAEYAFVKREERWGMIRTVDFESKVAFEFDSFSGVFEVDDQTMVSGIRGGNAVILRLEDNQMVEIPSCKEISPMYLGYFYIVTNEQNEQGIVNMFGQFLVPFGTYQQMDFTGEGYYISVKNNDAYGVLFCDVLQSMVYEIVPTEYENEVVLSSLGNAMVEKDDVYGVCSISGFEALPYQTVRPFVNDRAAFLTDDGWGFLNEELEVIVSPQYKSVSDFVGNYAVAEDESSSYVIDRSGNVVYRAVDSIEKIQDNLIITKGNTYYSILKIEKEGEAYLVEILYDNVLDFDSLDFDSYYSALFYDQEDGNVWTLMDATRSGFQLVVKVGEAQKVTRLYVVDSKYGTW